MPNLERPPAYFPRVRYAPATSFPAPGLRVVADGDLVAVDRRSVVGIAAEEPRPVLSPASSSPSTTPACRPGTAPAAVPRTACTARRPRRHGRGGRRTHHDDSCGGRRAPARRWWSPCVSRVAELGERPPKPLEESWRLGVLRQRLVIAEASRRRQPVRLSGAGSWPAAPSADRHERVQLQRQLTHTLLVDLRQRLDGAGLAHRRPRFTCRDGGRRAAWPSPPSVSAWRA